jgi:hypothetical protein
MELSNGLGHRVTLEVRSLSTAILVATGFPSAAVQAAELSGSYATGPGGPAGTLTYSVVAQGPDALLWLSGGEHLTLGGRTFDRAVTLLGKP